MENTNKEQLIDLIDNIRKEVQADIDDGTQIPQFYNAILLDLDNAEVAANNWDYDKCLKIIGSINLDVLKMLDDLDDNILSAVYQLYNLKKRLEAKWEDLPQEIYDLFRKIQEIVKKYSN
jgi:hypothetical protein